VSKENLPPAEVYHIDFSTEDGPGLLAVKVVLGSDYLPEGKEGIRIDLCNHPLYPKLERYVLSNPSIGRRRWGRKRI